MKIKNLSLSLFIICVIFSSILFSPCQVKATTSDTKWSSQNSGEFLAAYYAQNNHDFLKAYDFLKDIKDNKEHDFLLEQKLLAAILVAQYDEGKIIVKQLSELSKNSLISKLFTILADIKSNNFKVDLDAADTAIAPLIKSWVYAGLKDEKNALALRSQSKDSIQDLLLLHEVLILDYLGKKQQALDKMETIIAKTKGENFYYMNIYGNLLARVKGQQAAQDYFKQYEKTQQFSGYLYNYWYDEKSSIYTKPLIDNISKGLAHGLSMVGVRVYFTGDIENGLLLLQLSLFMEPQFDFALFNISEIYKDLEKYEESLSYARDIQPESPYYWPAAMGIVQSLDDLGQHDEAMTAIDGYIEMRNKDTQALLLKGDMLRQNKKYLEATQIYTQAIHRLEKNNFPEDWVIYYSRGVCYEQIKEWEQAETDLLKALSLEPNQPFILNYLGYSWIEQGKNLKEAQKMVETAVAARPNDGYITDSLGWVLYKLGKFDQALVYLERATLLLSNDPVVHDHLGDGYWKVSRKNEAYFQWQKVLDMNPDELLRESIENKLKNGLVDTP